MTENPIEIKVSQEPKKKGTWDKIKSIVKRDQALDSAKDSDRFSRLGYLQFPSRQQLDYRLTELTKILKEIEADLEGVETATVESEKEHAFTHIRKLFRAFMLLGAPWFRGLNNRELSRKAVIFYKLESMVGHLPSFYPDLKRCAETLLTLSWQAIDVTAETPVLFESRVNIQAPHGGIDLAGDNNANRPRRTEET